MAGYPDLPGLDRLRFDKASSIHPGVGHASILIERSAKVETASNFGTPVDIIEHHEQQISMVLAGLPD